MSRVTRSPWGRAESARAFSARITVPPAERGAKSSKIERSKQIEVPARTPESSSDRKVFFAQAVRCAALPCEIATALGTPVEPEV